MVSLVEPPRKSLHCSPFLRRHLDACTRGTALENVWLSSPEWQGGATVTEHIRRLRSKIEVDPDPPRWITTVRGVGYRFEPPHPATTAPGDSTEHVN